jgi:hypothetical protein
MFLCLQPHDIVHYRRRQQKCRHAQGNYDAMSSSGDADRDRQMEGHWPSNWVTLLDWYAGTLDRHVAAQG